MAQPPRNREAEQAIISGCLSGHRSDISPDDFHGPDHRIIYKTMSHLWNQGIEPDVVLIADQLRRHNKLEQAGGIEYLTRLVSDIPPISQDSVDRYAAVVKDLALLRHLARMGRRMTEAALDAKQPAGELLAHLFAQVSKMGAGENGGLREYSALIADTVERMEVRRKSPQDITGIPTPFRYLNRYTNGFQSSDLIIVAGRPSMGKSAFAAQLADFAAKHHGPALVYSLEMSKDQWGDRAISREARLDSRKIRTGRYSEVESQRVERAKQKLIKLQVEVDDTPGLTAHQILLSARKAKMRLGRLSMIVVDYLQLMRSHTRDQSRDQELGETTRLFKLCAKELECPVVLLSQLNRQPEARENKRPMLSDLRESGNIEQDADVILFIYRDEVYNRDSEKAGTAEIIISKQRNGPTGMVELSWLGEYTMFMDLSKEDSPNEQAKLDSAFSSDKKPDSKGVQGTLDLDAGSGESPGDS